MSAGTSRQIVDQSGRVLGPRALSTRQRLLEATRSQLERLSLRDLRVSDIARSVGASPATFYQYFRDASDAVLHLAEEASDEMPAIVETIAGSWQGEEGVERARRIAEAFIDHWDRHHAALRVRNTASDEGDERFQEVRNRAMTPVLVALARQVEAGQRAGRVPQAQHPQAAAAALAAILERLAAYHRELERFGVTREHLIDTTALIVCRTIAGD
jgi:AcrR family transcriptional regulator